MSGQQASKYLCLSLKMAIPTFGRKKKNKCPDGAAEGRTQRPVLGLMRGICAPARSSAVPTGERPHAVPDPQHTAGGNLHQLLLTRASPPGAFLTQGHYYAHYHQIMQCVGLCREGATQTFSQLISELVLSAAGILYS